MNEVQTQPDLVISHVADCYRRYPGERVTFFTRVDVMQAVAGFTIEISAPGFEPGQGHAMLDGSLPYLQENNGRLDWIWRVTGNQPAFRQHEFAVEATIPHTVGPPPATGAVALFDAATTLPWRSINLISQARVTYHNSHGEPVAVQETAAITVYPRGAYLQYLPSLYEQDDFMGRYLMLFESFWAPIEAQLQNIHDYFDPKYTPPRLLAWLASWFNTTLDDRWSESKQRALVAALVRLYHKRGTKQGLQEYLELYTGFPVEIIEYRADNFGLGQGSLLGQGVALGRENQPHSFTVKVRLSTAQEKANADVPSADQPVKAGNATHEQIIRSIIEAEKPAHTSYKLEILSD